MRTQEHSLRILIVLEEIVESSREPLEIESGRLLEQHQVVPFAQPVVLQYERYQVQIIVEQLEKIIVRIGGIHVDEIRTRPKHEVCQHRCIHIVHMQRFTDPISTQGIVICQIGEPCGCQTYIRLLLQEVS